MKVIQQMMKQINNNNSGKDSQEKVQTPTYLVTHAVDPTSIENEKISEDLSMLTKAEEKKEYRADIAKGIEKPNIQRAASALKMGNPFTGS